MKARSLSWGFHIYMLLLASQLVSGLLKPKHSCIESSVEKRLVICCREGEPKSLLKSFKRVSARLPSEDGTRLTVYEGANESAVEASYKQSQSMFHWAALLPWQHDQQPPDVVLNPFVRRCLGLAVRNESIPLSNIHWSLSEKAADALYVIAYVTGAILFLSSRKLSRNVVFYYGTGISIGILASILILCIILSRLVPGKKLGVAFIVGGFSTLLSALRYAWSRGIAQLTECCYEYIAIYAGLVGALSFAVLYWRGPVSEPRTLDLINWAIQFVAAALIYWAAQIHEVAVGTVVLLILTRMSYVFDPIVKEFKSLWRKFFPPRARLLTPEEYEQQATVETRRALEELRQYCRSPNCDAWKVVTRLQSPQRFASFVEGTSFHVSDSELLLYNSEGDSLSQPEMTDDEEENDDAPDFQLSEARR